MKHWRRVVVVLAVLVAVAASIVFFVLGTERGAHFAFDRIVAATDGKLSFGAVSGTLPAPLTLTDVRYRDPAAGIDLAIDRVVVDLGATALLSRRAVIQSLDADGVVLALTSVPDDDAKSSPWTPPLDLVVERARIGDITVVRDGEPLPRLDRIEVAGSWTNEGIEVRRFEARGPDGRVDLSGRFDAALGHRGSAKGTFAWRIDDRDWAGTLAATSDGRTARADVVLRQPLAARVELVMEPAAEALPWRATIAAPPFDPAVLGLGECAPDDAPCEPPRLKSLAATIQGSGDRTRFALGGEVVLNAHRVRVERFEGRIADDDVLHLAAVRLSSPEAPGALDASGTISYGADPPTASLDLAWRDVTIPADLAGRELATHGSAHVEGHAADYAVTGDFAIGEPGRVADVVLALRGDAAGATIESLRIAQGAAGLVGRGTLAYEPLAWTLVASADDFDPSPFAPAWPGSLDFELETEGRRDDSGVTATIRIEALSGTLRERAIAGDADLRIAPGFALDGRATLRAGDSRIDLEGRSAATADVVARLDIASLGDLLPGAAGRVEGQVRARGTWPALAIDAELEGRELFHDGRRARAASLAATIEDLEARRGRIVLIAQDVAVAGTTFDTLAFEADGDAASHTVRLDLAGARGTVALALAGGVADTGWRGRIETLALAPRDAPALALEAPAELAFVDGALAISESCFRVDEPGTTGTPPRLCLASERATDGAIAARYRVERVPLALLVGLASPGAPLRTEGVLDGSGEFSRDPGGAWRGTGTLASAAGVVAYPDTSERPLVSYTNLTAEAALAPGSMRLDASAALDEGGSFEARIGATDGALSGTVSLELASLRFIELLTPEIATPEGRLVARYAVSGTTAAPVLDGTLELSAFSAELPTVGLELSEGRATLRSTGDDRYVLEGAFQSGAGTLHLRGEGGLGAEAPLRVTVRGTNIQAVDIPGVNVVASPALVLTRRDGTLRLGGRIVVPEASINLARLPGGGPAKASPDVVVVDEPETAEARDALPLVTDVTIELGDRVEVRGHGLDGEVAGRLRVRERPGRAATGTGQIRISGTYRAYGQNLTIERGRLLFAQSPLDNPALDIRAVRKLRDVTPGLRVAGTAREPVLTVFSDPTMEQGNALSYLVTGRPLRSLSGEDGDTVGMAARALGTATGDLLAKRIGAKLGVDDIGVAESDALGGAAFTVGKYLSPRLYVSYGVGVFDPGTVVTLRYQLTEVWELEASSGTVENRAGVNYRYERD